MIGDPRCFLEEPLQVLSLGGGTQSTAMILMIEEGELEAPDLVMFADTGSETPETYAMIERCSNLCRSLEIEFVTVSKERDGVILPLHEGYREKAGLPLVGIRSCTSDWKIRPIHRYIRKIVGKGRGKVLASSWLGITTDERRRATPSHYMWIERRFPLLEKDMTRDDCVRYCLDRGYEVEKSGCFCCPYQPARQWSALRVNHPDLFSIALDMEQRAKARGFRGGLYRSQDSIERFNFDVTLSDFGFDFGDTGPAECDPDGGCFL